jgi:preprotein translocase subunit SecB
MSDTGNGGKAAAGAPQASAQPNLGVIAQYVKDLSFENPGAPETLRPRQKAPNLNVAIGVNTRQMSATDHEVELRIEARATDGETVLFAIELVYAGAFRLTNIPPADVQPITLIECPRLLFPFARQVLADASRNGGFPPLLLDPVDFVNLYRQRLAAEQGGQQKPRAV